MRMFRKWHTLIVLCAGVMIIALFKSTFVQGAHGMNLPEQNMLQPSGMAIATFAGGCFWCMEPPLKSLTGFQP